MLSMGAVPQLRLPGGRRWFVSLRDDPGINYEKRLVTVELLAKEHGWKHLCERQCIDIKMQNIYTA